MTEWVAWTEDTLSHQGSPARSAGASLYGSQRRAATAARAGPGRRPPRAAPRGTGYAKAAGNYAGQFYPTNLAKDKGFDQIVWTDSNEHKYLEEAGTMNIFFRIDNNLITAPVTDTILDGVTRKSIIQIAKDQGINVEIKKLSIDELKSSAKNGSLKEIFGAGTAAVVSEIKGFQHKEEYFEYNGRTYSNPNYKPNEGNPPKSFKDQGGPGQAGQPVAQGGGSVGSVTN